LEGVSIIIIIIIKRMNPDFGAGYRKERNTQGKPQGRVHR